jgi:hypothetical protein
MTKPALILIEGLEKATRWVNVSQTKFLEETRRISQI